MTSFNNYSVEVCSCSEGPYYGAQKMGTVTRCERCGFVSHEQLEAIQASAPSEVMLARLINRGVLTAESGMIWTDPEDGSKVLWTGTWPPASCERHLRFVTEWTKQTEKSGLTYGTNLLRRRI